MTVEVTGRARWWERSVELLHKLLLWRSENGVRGRPAPLADGGPHGVDGVGEAFAAVSGRYPAASADLSSLYLQAQCLLLPAACALCTRNIEQDLLTAERVLAARDRDTIASLPRMLAERAEVTRQYVLEHAETRATRQYVVGLLKAAAYSIVLLALIGLGGYLVLRSVHGTIPPEPAAALYHTLVAIGGGAAGAVVSVLSRTHHNIAYADDSSLVRAAVIRVILGWFFAAAMVFLVKGQVVDIINAPPTDNNVTIWFFWGAIGFLAGFNERWVRQLISRDPERT